MPIAFLGQIREIRDCRTRGIVPIPLDEILLSALIGGLCGGDGQMIELLSRIFAVS